MVETELTLLALGSIVVAMIGLVRAAHWKARFKTLDAERSCDGWEEECRFLRRIVNKDAAEGIE